MFWTRCPVVWTSYLNLFQLFLFSHQCCNCKSVTFQASASMYILRRIKLLRTNTASYSELTPKFDQASCSVKTKLSCNSSESWVCWCSYITVAFWWRNDVMMSSNFMEMLPTRSSMAENLQLKGQMSVAHCWVLLAKYDISSWWNFFRNI